MSLKEEVEGIPGLKSLSHAFWFSNETELRTVARAASKSIGQSEQSVTNPTWNPFQASHL